VKLPQSQQLKHLPMPMQKHWGFLVISFSKWHGLVAIWAWSKIRIVRNHDMLPSQSVTSSYTNAETLGIPCNILFKMAWFGSNVGMVKIHTHIVRNHDMLPSQSVTSSYAQWRRNYF
jgi:hypothetical protein